MIDDKKVNYKLDAISKLINNLKLSISGNKEHDELGENNVIINLDEISQKITDLHNMVQAEFNEFEEQHQNESDETQTLLNERFTLVLNGLTTINNSVNALRTSNETKLTAVVNAINSMKESNDTKNDAIIAALQGLVTRLNENTNDINSLNSRVNALEQG